MVACVPYKKLFVLNARDLYGIMEEGSFNVHSVLATSVKMTNLNTRHLAKFWRQKRTSASHVTDTASTLA